MPLMEPIEGCSSVCSTISHAPGMMLLRHASNGEGVGADKLPPSRVEL